MQKKKQSKQIILLAYNCSQCKQNLYIVATSRSQYSMGIQKLTKEISSIRILIRKL